MSGLGNMVSPGQLLALLIGAALGMGGWLLGRSVSAGGGGAMVEALEEQLRISREEIEMLDNENQSLRSLAQGGGEVSVPLEMISQVEMDYGLEFLSNPVINRVAKEELGYRVEAATESRMGPQGIDDRQEAYQHIGWLRKEDRLLDQLVAVKLVGARGWFDEQTGEAWVTDQFDAKNIPDQAAMLRLLVRVLLNQHFPIGASYPGDDAARAWEALHAGAASGAEARFYAVNAREIGFIPMNDNSAAARLLLTLPDFVQGISVFPSIEGKGLADTLFVKGTEPLQNALRNPPTNTFNVVLPAETERGGKVEFAEISDEIYLRESAGYLGLRLWVAEMGDVGLAEEIAREWKRDGYVLFADGDSSSAVKWEIELESAEMTDRLQEIVLGRLAAMTGKSTAATLGEILKTQDERYLRVIRKSENQLLFLNTATEKTAAK